MKRIIYLSLCACLLTSCSLDLQPENGLTYSNSFNTEKELNATTTSIQYYINTTVGNNYDFATAGVVADDILGGKQLREWNPR
ncbi:MAG: RagB/SusD family nutrient uptake outer membrane protein, partial [Prevotella histicola]